MFWVFSDSLRTVRHIISSVNKGNTLFLQGFCRPQSQGWLAIEKCDSCVILLSTFLYPGLCHFERITLQCCCNNESLSWDIMYSAFQSHINGIQMLNAGKMFQITPYNEHGTTWCPRLDTSSPTWPERLVDVLYFDLWADSTAKEREEVLHNIGNWKVYCDSFYWMVCSWFMCAAGQSRYAVWLASVGWRQLSSPARSGFNVTW